MTVIIFFFEVSSCDISVSFFYQENKIVDTIWRTLHLGMYYIMDCFEFEIKVNIADMVRNKNFISWSTIQAAYVNRNYNKYFGVIQ